MTAYATPTTTGIVVRTAILAGLWWIIVQGRSDAWLVGLPAVAAAVGRSLPSGSLLYVGSSMPIRDIDTPPRIPD